MIVDHVLLVKTCLCCAIWITIGQSNTQLSLTHALQKDRNIQVTLRDAWLISKLPFALPAQFNVRLVLSLAHLIHWAFF